ncbi:maleylpyruvate isomerase family mycothiol-dependent enzyme [Cellulomonas humilata]|uniref:Uncharacterized protein (TIGR03083 family) n=1 Tax=Cellulomonas humilata TaxID=144055 RepID=A0ABU0EJH4_9CELL|nr:maleylpyruvate isomerase family mycothiol-dependent enzyme [Cellulomonas humilata]MDQ0375218.1 uncharacterized protein (TIGR03083 family) [Cellulomonas humilata]
MDYAGVIALESARMADALAEAPPTAQVPSCPDWSTADLAYHLGEVQDFWSQIVGNAPAGPDDAQDTERLPDDELVPFLRTRTQALLTALAAHDPADPCWSWSPVGGTVGWVLRRQAHEALVHRVDAEQTAGLPVTDPGTALAADGVDEMLGVMVSGLPSWATFTPDGRRVRLLATDAGREWVMAFGRFHGTSPTTGKEYDDECAELVGGAPWEGEDEDVTATVAGPAWDLELWLWGRGSADGLTVDGDEAAVDRLRAVIVESTQ